MDSATVSRLLDLNRQFYQTFGRAFSDKRQRLQPGVRRILDMLNGDEHILDLGCGNGELARELARRGHEGAYLGLDFSLPLLEVAGRQPGGFPAEFVQADLSTPIWDASLSPGVFSLVTCFAVLHHLPGYELRLETLRKIRHLLSPSGRLVHSNWQFLNSQRLRERIQPWSAARLTPEHVDDDDYLLDWRHGGHGLRYVHHFRQDELTRLATESGFTIEREFYSDGENARLNLYQIWLKA